MQLADDVNDVKHAGLTHALAAKGITLTAGGHHSEAHQIARKAVQLATEIERNRMQQANASPGTYLDEGFGLPPLTNEKQVGIVQNAIEAVRSTPVERPDEPLEVSAERRIEMWEHELDEALKGLRGGINDDNKQFRQVVKSHWEAIWNA